MSSGKAFIGKPAPDFTATAVMPDGQFKDIKLSDYKGKFMCFCSYTGSLAIGRSEGYLKIHLDLILK